LAENVVAFLRSEAGTHCLVVAPRMPGRVLGGGDSIVIPPDVWRDTVLHLPDELVGRTMRDAFSGECVEVVDTAVRLDRLLSTFPVALLATE
jgi:maltooligosyltrehalose synthase